MNESLKIMYAIARMLNLKPCPFCGGTPYIGSAYYDGESFNIQLVCSECEMKMPRGFGDANKVISNWNREGNA